MFVWFVAVIRRRVGERENRFFGTVFFGSALLLTGAWLVAAVFWAAPAVAGQAFDTVPDAGTVAMTQAGAHHDGVDRRNPSRSGVHHLDHDGRAPVGGAATLAGPHRVRGRADVVTHAGAEVLLTWVFPIWVAIVSVVLLFRRAEISKPAVG